MLHLSKLPKLQPGDQVAIVSPSFVAPTVFPAECELGLRRLREQFQLDPVVLPGNTKSDATHEDRIADLIEAFSNSRYKAVITTLGGSHQIEYVKKLPQEPFRQNPKPFFGYSDNSHFAHFLFQCGVPSYYGGCIYTEFAMQGQMDPFTERYLRIALFGEGPVTLEASESFNDEDLPWGEVANHSRRRRYQPNEGWYWDGTGHAQGVTWGGCLESIDEMLRHGAVIPDLSTFKEIVLFLETSEEIPSSDYVRRVLRALGERGILGCIQGLLIGRPKAWSFENPQTDEEKCSYKAKQRQSVIDVVRRYNQDIPIVQNMDFGHTAPMFCLPYGRAIQIHTAERVVTVEF